VLAPVVVKLEAFVAPIAGESVNVWFEYSTYNGLVERTNPTVVSFPTTVSIQILGLKEGTQYHFQVVAQNTRGFVYGEVEDFIFNSSSFNLPYATTRNATSIRDTSATLEGYIDPINGTDTEFWFEWGETKNLGLKTTKTKHFGGASSVRAILTGLKRGDIYYYRVVIKNSRGLNRGNILDFIAGEHSILPSQKPTSSAFGSASLIAVATKAYTITGNTVEISAKVATGGEVSTTGWFEWGDTESLGLETAHRNIGAGYPTINFTETLEGLTPNKTYYFRAVAQNANGLGRGDLLTFQISQIVGLNSNSGASGIDVGSAADSDYGNGLIQVDDKGNIISWFGGKVDDDSKKEEKDNGQKATALNVGENGIFPDTIFGWILLLLLIVLLVGYSHYFYGVYRKRKEEVKRKVELEQKTQE